MPSTEKPTSAKVRVACQRCRVRRIKCDGGASSCTNCSRAGVECIDADARYGDTLIPRNTIARARSRIAWLEKIIATELPTIDLSKAPQVDFEPSEEAQASLQDRANSNPAPQHGQHSSTAIPAKTKRSREEVDTSMGDETFQADAKLVAYNFGRLSLNADSRETHYIGSSSGIFSYLVQADSPQSDTALSRTTSHREPLIDRTRKQKYVALCEKLQQNLPPKDEALRLIEKYILHIHPDHPVMHIESILSATDALYDCSQVFQNQDIDTRGWPLNAIKFSYNGDATMGSEMPISLPTALFHIFMIFTIAASLRIGNSQGDVAPTKFYEVVTSVAQDVLEQTDTASTQSVYLLAIYALMTPSKLNIWTLTYICVARAIDLGIHRKQINPSSTSEIARSLLFYSIYSMDRSIAAIQGRPLGIRDETFDVELPQPSELQAEIQYQNIAIEYKAFAQLTSHYILHRLSLDEIISEIKTLFYFLPSKINPRIWNVADNTNQKRLHDQLQRWFSAINEACSDLSDQGHQRIHHELKLELAYHSAMILLFQPSQVVREPTNEGLQLCFTAAMRQITCYNSIHDYDLLHFDWRVVRNILACGATVIYCFWKSEDVQNSESARLMPGVLRSCTNLLAVGGIWWPSVKKGKASLERLIDLTLQKAHQVYSDESDRTKKRRAQRTSSRFMTNAAAAETAFRTQAPTSSFQNVQHQFPNHDPNFHNDIPVLPESSTDYQWLFSGQLSTEELQANQAASTNPTGLEDFNIANSASTLEPGSVDPEIEAFLTDYFLDFTSSSVPNVDGPGYLYFNDL